MAWLRKIPTVSSPRHKHLDLQALQDLEDTEIYFEQYLAYTRLAEFTGALPLAYGPWKESLQDDQEDSGCDE